MGDTRGAGAALGAMETGAALGVVDRETALGAVDRGTTFGAVESCGEAMRRRTALGAVGERSAA
eukprot:1898932-Pleurochrysis_carterae.AAC.1